jgi:hypothetical protein
VAVQGVSAEGATPSTGLSKPAEDGVSTKIVPAKPCSTAAKETDGTTTCVGIPDKRQGADYAETLMENAMSRKPEETRPPKKAKAEDKLHKPAKHIEETARLSSSVERKDPQKVRKTED